MRWRPKRNTTWLGLGYDKKSRPVQTKRPTAVQVAQTVLQELHDPGYMVSFYDGDVIRTNDALRILAKEVLADQHCATCECIHATCGAVIGSAQCTDFHERKKHESQKN